LRKKSAGCQGEAELARASVSCSRSILFESDGHFPSILGRHQVSLDRRDDAILEAITHFVGELGIETGNGHRETERLRQDLAVAEFDRDFVHGVDFRNTRYEASVSELSRKGIGTRTGGVVARVLLAFWPAGDEQGEHDDRRLASGRELFFHQPGAIPEGEDEGVFPDLFERCFIKKSIGAGDVSVSRSETED